MERSVMTYIKYRYNHPEPNSPTETLEKLRKVYDNGNIVLHTGAGVPVKGGLPT